MNGIVKISVVDFLALIEVKNNFDAVSSMNSFLNKRHDKIELELESLKLALLETNYKPFLTSVYAVDALEQYDYYVTTLYNSDLSKYFTIDQLRDYAIEQRILWENDQEVKTEVLSETDVQVDKTIEQ